MLILTQIGSAFALIFAGVLKIAAHVDTATSLTLQMCSGRTVAIALQGSAGGPHGVHCWGCYAVLAGVVLIFLIFWQLRRRRFADMLT